jgi:hypothetical protein
MGRRCHSITLLIALLWANIAYAERMETSFCITPLAWSASVLPFMLMGAVLVSGNKEAGKQCITSEINTPETETFAIAYTELFPAAGEKKNTTPTTTQPALIKHSDPIPPPPPTQPSTSPSPAATFADETLLILDVWLGKTQLSDGMMSYYDQGKLYIPLEFFTNLLGFSITSAPDAGEAEGMAFEPFHLILNEHRVTMGDHTMRVENDSVRNYGDDLYVEQHTLETWFPILLEFSLSRQRLNVKSTRSLPTQEAALRKQRGERLTMQRTDYSSFPTITTPHHAITAPVMDVRVVNRLQSEAPEHLQSQASVLATQDLLTLDSSTFLSLSDDQGIDRLRMTLGKKSPDQTLLGPLHASEFAMGDVLAHESGLVAHSHDARGITFSNQPLDQVVEGNRITLRGDLAPGWEVELYRNEVLLAFSQARDDGLYEFTDIPLVRGTNFLKMVFYGPNGQRREEIKRVMSDAGLLKIGEHRYQFSAVQDSTPLMPFGEDRRTHPESEGKARVSASYEQGIEENLSLKGEVTHIPLEDGTEHNYVSAFLSHAYNGVLSIWGISQQAEGGTALQSAFRTSVSDISLDFTHQEFLDGFTSDFTQSPTNPLLRHSEFRADTSVTTGIPEINRLSLGLNGARESFADGSTRWQINQRSSTAWRYLSLSHFFRYDGGDTAENLEGDVLMSFRFYPFMLRGDYGYGIRPELASRMVNLMGEYNLDEDTAFRLGLSRALENTQLTTYSAGVNRRFDYCIWGVNGRYDTNDDWVIESSVSFSLYPEEDFDYSIYPTPLASQGNVVAYAFQDNNDDGLFNEGDAPLPDIGFKRGRIRAKPKTNETGRTWLHGFYPYRTVPVVVDKSSVNDPYLVPKQEAVNVITHAGSTTEIAFPFVPTGEVDGTVYVNHEAYANVLLHLVDAQSGKEIATARSQYDGFFLFSFVPMGHYRIVLDHDQAFRLRLREDAMPESILLSPEDPVASGEDVGLGR